MNFNDEFEHVIDGSTYFVKVEGRVVEEETFLFNEIDKIEIYDSLGDKLDSDDTIYDTIYEEALNREYEIDLDSDSREFSEDSYIDSFLRDGAA